MAQSFEEALPGLQAAGYENIMEALAAYNAANAEAYFAANPPTPSLSAPLSMPIFGPPAPSGPEPSRVEQVRDFIEQNISNPQAIADAAAKFNVTAEEIQQATGVSPEGQRDFFAQANVTPTYQGLKITPVTNLNVAPVAETMSFLPVATGTTPVTAPDYTSIVTGAYKNILDREADKSGQDYWMEQLRSGKVTPANFESTFKSIAQPELDVQQLYKDVLGRKFDPTGLQYWTEKIGSYGITPEERKEFIRQAVQAGELKADDPRAIEALQTSSVTTPQIEPIRYGDQTYDRNELLKLASQIGSNITSLSGGVFNETRPSVGFDYETAKTIFGADPKIGDQVVLDMAKSLIDRGITDISQIQTRDVLSDTVVYPRYDGRGNITGYYRIVQKDEFSAPEEVELRPDEIAKVEHIADPSGESYGHHMGRGIATGKELFAGDNVLTQTTPGSQDLEFVFGQTFSGPGRTNYQLIQNPTTGKLQFSAFGGSTGEGDLISGAMTVLSFVPGAQPFVYAVNAAMAIKNNDPLGVAASLLNMGGQTGAASTISAIRAAEKGDYTGVVTSLVNNPTFGGKIGNIELAGNITVADAANAVKFAAAVSKDDWVGAVNAAASLTNSADLKTAATGLKIVQAAEKGDFQTLINASKELDTTIKASNNIVNTDVGTKVSSTITTSLVDQSGSNNLTDAVLNTTMNSGATKEQANETATTLTEVSNIVQGDEDDTTIDVTDRNQVNDAITKGITKVDMGEFAGFDDAVKEAVNRNVLKIGNAEADSLQEAAALAGSKGYSNFSYAGDTYSLSATARDIITQANQQEIASQGNFNDAYKTARELLGAGKTFEWNGKAYSTDTRAENPTLAAASDAVRGITKDVSTPQGLDEAVKSVQTTVDYGGPRIFGVPVGTAQDAINTVSRMGEVVTDFSRGIGKGFGNFLDAVGALGHIMSAGAKGGDTKNALIARDNLLSSVGQNIAQYYGNLTTEQSQREWNNIVKAVNDAPEYLKPIVAVTSTLQNFGGFVSKIGEEVGETIAPVGGGIALGSKVLQLSASGTARTVGLTATLGDMAESAQSSFDEVSQRLQNNRNMTDSEKYWAATQAASTSMAATALFGYGANAYLAKSLIGDMTGNAAQKVLGPMAVEYISEYPESVAQKLGERYAEKGSINQQDLREANTDASISSLIGAKTAGTITGTVQVMGVVSNGFVGAADGDRSGVAIVQNSQGQTALVPASGLQIGQNFEVDNLQQLQTPSDVVNQFNFTDEDAGRITESVQNLIDTQPQRNTQAQIDANSFDPSQINIGSSLEAGQNAQTSISSTPSGDTVTSTTQGNVTTSVTKNSAQDSSTVTKVNNDSGITTQTTTTPNNNIKVTSDPNTNTTTSVDTNRNTNVETTTTTDTKSNAVVQSTVNPNTNINTETTVNPNTKITTESTTDNNNNIKTTVTTDQNTNTQSTTTVDTKNNTVIDTKVTKIPTDWTEPVIVTPTPTPTPAPTPAPTPTPTPAPTPAPTPGPRPSPTPRPVQQLGGLLPILGAPEVVKDEKSKFKDPFITSRVGQQKFEGSLDPFLAEVQAGSYLEPAQEPQTESRLDEETEMMKYFTYGIPTDIDEVFFPPKPPAENEDEFETQLAAARGGLATPLMARGGLAHYASGGLPMVAHSGKARLDFRQGAAVSGPGDGQSDDIPAMLADGEFVFPADVVAALGNGSTKAGSKKLYDMMHSIRAHHRSAKPQDLPPPAKKNPLDYLKSAKNSRR